MRACTPSDTVFRTGHVDFIFQSEVSVSTTLKIEDVRYQQFRLKDAEPVLGMVHAFRKNNYRKTYGKESDSRKTRQALFVYGGWDPQYPLIAEVASEEEIQLAIAEREDFHKILVAQASIAGEAQDLFKAKLQVFENPASGYMNAKGKIVGPQLIGVTGNRRLGLMLDVAGMVLLEGARATKVEDLHLALPVLVPKLPGNRFPSEMLRLEAQIRENSTKTEGFLEPSDAENLNAVDRMVSMLASQNDVRKHYGATAGLRYYFGVQIAKYAKRSKHGLNLLERWTAKPYIDVNGEETEEREYTIGSGADKKTVENQPNPNWLDFSKFSQGAFQGLKGPKVPEWLNDKPVGRMCDTQDVFDRMNDDRKKASKSLLDRPSKAFLEDWVQYCMTGSTGIHKVMRPEVIKRMFSDECHAVAATAKVVYNDDPALLDELHVRSTGLNAVMAFEAPAYGKLAPALDRVSTMSPELQLEFAEQVSKLAEGFVKRAEVPATTNA